MKDFQRLGNSSDFAGLVRSPPPSRTQHPPGAHPTPGTPPRTAWSHPAGNSTGELSGSGPSSPPLHPGAAPGPPAEVAPPPRGDWSGRVVPRAHWMPRPPLPSNPPSGPRLPATAGGPGGPSSRQHLAWRRRHGRGLWAGSAPHTHPAHSAEASGCRPPPEPCPFPSRTNPCLQGCSWLPARSAALGPSEALGFRKCNGFTHFQGSFKPKN